MTRRLVLLGAAAFLALAGVAGVLAHVAGADERALAGVRAVEVLLAAGPIAEGTPFARAQAAGLITSARYPADALPPDALVTVEGLAPDAVATRDVAARELLLAGTFGTEVDGGTVAGLTLPPGTAAVPVSMAAFPGSEDWSTWISPGSEIAVYLTFRTRSGPTGPLVPGAGVGAEPGSSADESRHEATRLLLDRVTVLAVGDVGIGAAAGAETADDEEGAEAESSGGGAAMVLALTQQQTERLIMGVAREGRLYPVLISPDSGVVPSPGTLDNEIFNPLAPAPGVVGP